MCEVYKATGVCWIENCRQRHPIRCWYGYKCYRGKCCSYLHDSLACNWCEQMSDKRYYCEFCGKSFCERCTSKDAHINSIYKLTRSLIVKTSTSIFMMLRSQRTLKAKVSKSNMSQLGGFPCDLCYLWFGQPQDCVRARCQQGFQSWGESLGRTSLRGLCWGRGR